jgi:putative transcriptional regulator
MRKRDIGQEVLDSIRDIKAGKIGRVAIFMSPDEIKKVRLNIGATQRSFAAMMNISLRTVQDWEQGRRKPDGPAQSLLAIAATRPDVIQEVFMPT